MKFVFIKREPLSFTDGIGQFLFAVSDALIRMGHEVTCLTTADTKLATIPQNYDFENYPRLEAIVDNDSTLKTKDAARLWRKHGQALVSKYQPDLIILNGGLPIRFPFPTALIAHDAEARSVFRNAFLGNLGRIAFKAITYRLVDQLIVTCPELAGPVAKDSLCSPKQFTIIPTCIDTRRYQPQPLEKRQPVIVHCGFHDYKRPVLTAEAFAKMQNKNARLVIVGKVVDANAQAEINRLPDSLRQRIEMPGIVSVEELKRLLTTSRVISIPSLYKIPVASPTVLEALAGHTPSVLSPSISTIVADPGTNCFVEASAEGMARRFDELIGDDEVWAKLSKGCAKTKVKFDSMTVAKEYEALAHKLRK